MIEHRLAVGLSPVQRRASVLLVAAVAIAAVTACGSGSSPHPTTSARATGTTATSSAATSSTAAASSATSARTTSAPVTTFTTGAPAITQFVPLYPFADIAAVSAWEAAYRSGGHQPWHRDADLTAVSFVGFLGFTGINIVTSSHQSAGDAHVGVGYRNPSGAAMTAAVIHLVRYGSDDIAPWEVVGTDDTTFTVTRPTYGARVTSPVTVGGTITGVDENIVVTIRQLPNQAPVGTHAGVPAGGQSTPWSVQVFYHGAVTGPLIIVATTGGHLQAVERFAVTGART